MKKIFLLIIVSSFFFEYTFGNSVTPFKEEVIFSQKLNSGALVLDMNTQLANISVDAKKMLLAYNYNNNYYITYNDKKFGPYTDITKKAFDNNNLKMSFLATKANGKLYRLFEGIEKEINLDIPTGFKIGQISGDIENEIYMYRGDKNSYIIHNGKKSSEQNFISNLQKFGSGYIALALNSGKDANVIIDGNSYDLPYFEGAFSPSTILASEDGKYIGYSANCETGKTDVMGKPKNEPCDKYFEFNGTGLNEITSITYFDLIAGPQKFIYSEKFEKYKSVSTHPDYPNVVNYMSYQGKIANKGKLYNLGTFASGSIIFDNDGNIIKEFDKEIPYYPKSFFSSDLNNYLTINNISNSAYSGRSGDKSPAYLGAEILENGKSIDKITSGIYNRAFYLGGKLFTVVSINNKYKVRYNNAEYDFKYTSIIDATGFDDRIYLLVKDGDTIKFIQYYMDGNKGVVTTKPELSQSGGEVIKNEKNNISKKDKYKELFRTKYGEKIKNLDKSKNILLVSKIDSILTKINGKASRESLVIQLNALRELLVEYYSTAKEEPKKDLINEIVTSTGSEYITYFDKVSGVNIYWSTKDIDGLYSQPEAIKACSGDYRLPAVFEYYNSIDAAGGEQKFVDSLKFEIPSDNEGRVKGYWTSQDLGGGSTLANYFDSVSMKLLTYKKTEKMRVRCIKK